MANRTSRQHGFTIIELLIIIVIIGVLGVLAWVFLHRSATSAGQTAAVIATPTEQYPSVTASDSMTPTDVTNKIRAALLTKYTYYNGTDAVPAGDISTLVTGFALPYKASDYPYYISYDDGSTLFIDTAGSTEENDASIASTATDREVRRTDDNLLTQLKFTKVAQDKADAGKYDDVYAYGNLICIATRESTEIGDSRVSCGTKTGYDAALTASLPFGDKVPNVTSEWVVDSVTITQSPQPGYQTGRVFVSESPDAQNEVPAYFYKQDGGSWTYLGYGQDLMECVTYPNQDVRNAFQEWTCE